MTNISVIQDAENKQWLRFSDPCEVIAAFHIDEVVPKLKKIETAVNEQGLYAAGFISYEASPAFDVAFRVHPPDDFPLLRFGLYRAPEKINLPPLPEKIVQLPENWTPSVGKTEYDQAIARIKTHIAQGDTYQVNYTFRLNAPFFGDTWQLFLELMAVQQTKYAAYIDTGRFALCSASPELFFHLKGHELTLRPMKGTAPRAMTLSEDKKQALRLHYSEKNRAENVMIADMIRNDAGRIAATGSVHVPKLFEVEKYPTLWQMTSTVKAHTYSDLCDIMTALFPCASITGAPKSSTMKIIAALETKPRRVYTGCIGFIAPGRNARFNIAIRTVIVDKSAQTAEYGVGGGIVWDSDTAEEYEECRIKARVLSRKQPDFSLLETLLWEPGKGYFLLEYHLRRLRDSAEYFDFPFEAEQVQETLEEMVFVFDKNKFYKVRLVLSKGSSISCQPQSIVTETFNLSPATCNLQPATCNLQPATCKLRVSPTPVHSDDPFLYHKTTYRRIYETARESCPDCDDVILYNERGEVTETTVANIVIEQDGKLITPPVSCGLLAGTFRSWLLEQGEISEQLIPLEMLARSEHIYLINSVRKWRKGLVIEK